MHIEILIGSQTSTEEYLRFTFCQFAISGQQTSIVRSINRVIRFI